MADEIRVDSGQLAELAGRVLSASGTLANALAAGRDSLIIAPAAFGDSLAGPAVHDSHAAIVESGASTCERLVEVMEGDVDRIYRVAFAYEQMERENADHLCRGTSGGGPTPC